MNIFGDVVVNEEDLSFDELQKIIKRSLIKPRYRLSVLNPDETIEYEIPNEDIPEDGISYNEEYQNGQRRSITLKLINTDGKYTPSINGIWLSTKFKFDIGLETNKGIVWSARGVYIMGDVNLSHSAADDTVTIQLKDKYAMFEGKLGTLEDPYEIELGSSIDTVLTDLMHFTMGNGYILDYKDVILDPSFIGFKTQATIRVDEGGNLGQIIDALATQLSAEYYYNNVGNLCFYPLNETVDDANKPIIWTFDSLNMEPHDIALNYRNEEVINVVKVVGDNIDNGICSAIVTNENPSSPICIQRVGRRAAPKYNEANVWNDTLALDLANYYLRQNSFVAVDFSCVVPFNPILTVNNLVEVENEFLQFERDKLLITSISYGSMDGLMSLRLCNVADLPSNMR